jgi:hypothetical protein
LGHVRSYPLAIFQQHLERKPLLFSVAMSPTSS